MTLFDLLSLIIWISVGLVSGYLLSLMLGTAGWCIGVPSGMIILAFAYKQFWAWEAKSDRYKSDFDNL